MKREDLTGEAAVEVGAGGDAQSGVRHQEARDLREARRDVLAQRLQLRVLLVRHLAHTHTHIH